LILPFGAVTILLNFGYMFYCIDLTFWCSNHPVAAFVACCATAALYSF
jgi:hypothetical protein